MNLSMFLKKDQEKAKRELDCYGYLHGKAIELFAQGEFGMAASYYENMARSARELQRIKNNKLVIDEAASLLKELNTRSELTRRQWF